MMGEGAYKYERWLWSILVALVSIPLVLTLVLPTSTPQPERAKVSRVRGDHRVLRVALESYQQDHGAFPMRLTQLTTPVAYIDEFPFDPFVEPTRAQRRATDPETWEQMRHRMRLVEDGEALLLWSIGPDRVDDRGTIQYDPTNGTVSRGDVIWVVAPDHEMESRVLLETIVGAEE